MGVSVFLSQSYQIGPHRCLLAGISVHASRRPGYLLVFITLSNQFNFWGTFLTKKNIIGECLNFCYIIGFLICLLQLAIKTHKRVQKAPLYTKMIFEYGNGLLLYFKWPTKNCFLSNADIKHAKTAFFTFFFISKFKYSAVY